MAIFLFADNASSTLAANIGPSSTTITLAPGDGALFPSPAAGQQFTLTLNDAATHLQFETTYCTHRAGDVLTVVRGQEGTTAASWLIGDQAFNGPTSGTMQAFLQTQHVTDGSLNPVVNNLTVNGNETVGGTLAVTGAASAASITSAGTINAGTSIHAGTSIVAVGAVDGNAINSSTTIAATGDITTSGGNISTGSGGEIDAGFGGFNTTGNITAASGTITGNAINSTTTIAAGGNISGAAINGTAINSTGTIHANGAITGASLSVTGNVAGSSINSSGSIAAGGNVSGASLVTGAGGSVSAGTGGIATTGNASITGSALISGGLVALGNIELGTNEPHPIANTNPGWNVGATGEVSSYAGSATPLSIGTSGTVLLSFAFLSSSVASITTNGSSVTYNTTSDYRIKTILGPYRAGDLIDAVPVHEGAYNTTPDIHQPLFLAHEVEAVAPWLVIGDKDAVVDHDVISERDGKTVLARAGDPILQQLDVMGLIPILWAANQELRARVAALEAKLA